MNFFQKRFLTLAAFIANISLTLVVAGVATFAWFQENINVNVDVMSSNVSIESAGPNEGLSYEVLKYDDNIKAGRSYTGSEAVAQFTLPDYDSYITEKNQYANVILRADVTTSALNTTTEELTIDISRLASSFKTAGVIGSNTSNVIQFKSTVYKYKISDAEEYTINTSSHNSIDETNAATKYATASSYFASKKTPTTFVPIRDSGDGTVIVNRKAEADTITLIPDLPTGLTLTSVIVYIECTYHETLVNEFIASHSESDMTYSLDGDISLIKFGKRTKTANVSHATGKYIKVESEVTASSGQYLPTYEASAGNGKILKGSLANGSDSIDVNNNLRPVAINNSTATEPQSIDSTDTIDDEAFAYDRVAKTLKSKSGYYIGNNRAGNNYNIDTSTSPENKTNTITFDQGHPVITSDSGKMLQHYSSGSTDRIRYYAASHPLDLYRYTENVAEMPTLVSIAITQTPTSAQRTFYTNHTFNLNGLEVTATYSDSSTAVVTHSCSFTSPNGVRTLIPEGRTSPTTFTTAQANKTVNISYSEGAVTLTNAASYIINIEDEAITSLSKEGSLSTTNYYVGDTFSSTGVTVYGEYNSGIEHANVTSSCTFDGYNMSVAGSYTVVAHYNGLNINVGTIIVREKTLEISVDSSDVSGQTLNLYFTEQLTIKVTHTASVSVSKSNSYVSLSSSSIAYTGATYAAQDHNLTVTAGSTAGSTVLTFSVSTPSGFTSKTVTIKVKKMPVETLTITPTKPSWSTSGYGSGSYTATTDGSSSINLSASNVMNQSSTIQIKSGGSFQSSSTIGSYIKSISVDYSANNYYQISASTNGTSWTSIGTFNADHTSTFTESNGYKYFKIAASGGYTQLNSVTVQYYVVSVVDVTGIHTQPSSYYVNDTPSVNDFLLDVTMSDDTTSTVVPTSISLNTSVAGNNISGTATYSGASGTQSVSFTINIINRLVTGITVNLSASSVGVGGSATATATVTPSNATTKTVTWSSSNTNVATINESTGAISAVATGTCTFTATATDGSGVTGTSSTFTVNASYSVTYQPNGGTGSNYVVSNVMSGSSHTLVSFATSGFTAPSGKEFKCWSVGGVEKDPGASITVSANTTVLAVWKDASTGYVISYDGNGSTGGTAVSANASGNYVLKTNTWTRTNYTFAGWAVNTGSGYVKMAAGATVTGVTGNITVKAIWSRSITLTTSSFGLSGTTYYSKSYTDSISGTTFNTTDSNVSNGLNFKKSTGALWNSTALPGRIVSVSFASITFSSSSSAGFYVYGADSAKATTTTLLNNSGSTSTLTVDFSSHTYSYFYIKNKGTRTVSFGSGVTVTYEIW